MWQPPGRVPVAGPAPLASSAKWAVSLLGLFLPDRARDGCGFGGAGSAPWGRRSVGQRGAISIFTRAHSRTHWSTLGRQGVLGSCTAQPVSALESARTVGAPAPPMLGRPRAGGGAPSLRASTPVRPRGTVRQARCGCSAGRSGWGHWLAEELPAGCAGSGSGVSGRRRRPLVHTHTCAAGVEG